MVPHPLARPLKVFAFEIRPGCGEHGQLRRSQIVIADATQKRDSSIRSDIKAVSNQAVAPTDLAVFLRHRAIKIRAACPEPRPTKNWLLRSRLEPLARARNPPSIAGVRRFPSGLLFSSELLCCGSLIAADSHPAYDHNKTTRGCKT